MYPEFDDLLPKIKGKERSLAMRLWMVPALSDPNGSQALRDIMLDESKPTLDMLPRHEVLVQAQPPSYGRGKRAEAAAHWFEGTATRSAAS